MLHSINIFIHVLIGTLGIFIGLMPYFTEKGGKRHRQFGRVFLWMMAAVILTALNGVIFFRDRPFLTVVTLLSMYTTYSGYRVLKTKEKGFSHQDFGVMLLVILMAISFVLNLQKANVLWHASIVYYLLAYVFLIVGFDIVRYFFPKLIRVKRFWLYEHIYKMTASFTALISAGAGTVFAAYEPYNQIVPAIFSTWWLIFCLIYFPRQMKKGKMKEKYSL